MTEELHLSPRHREEIKALQRQHLPDVEVWAYGSRVNGRSHGGSDLDLVLRGPKLAEIDTSRLADFIEALQNSTIPFLVEVRDWARLPESFHCEIERAHVALVVADQDDRPERKPRGSRPFGELFAESTRNGLTRPKAVRGSGVKMVNMGELFAHPRLCNVPMDRVPLSQSEAERLLLEDGDLLFARQSLVLEGAGKCSIFLRDDEPVTFESHVTRVRLDPKKAHPGYYFYYLQSHQGRSAIRSIVEQGAGASGIRASDLATLEVQWRPLPEQRAIAHILGALDDKIELNRRMNETLEAMARALFKSWFVDFEPVRAKMAGRDTGLPQDLADLFPDRLVDSELGKIPEGWKVNALGELTRKPQYGYTESAKDAPIGPKFLRITDINKKAWIEWELVPHCEITEENFEKYRLYRDDILIARMADPGHGCMIEEDQQAAFASYLIRFRPLQERYARFLQYWLRSDAYWELVRERGAGTTRVSLNAKVLSGFPLVVPTDPPLDQFSDKISSLRSRVVSNTKESYALAAQRDALLPKLVSGEVRTPHGAYGTVKGS